MYNSCLDAFESKAARRPRTSTDVARRLLRWMGYALAVGIAGGMLFLAVRFVQSSIVTIKGKVISSNTKTPIGDVMVAVESGMPDEESGLGSYVKTDDDGKFSAKAKGKVSVRIWKSGYAMNGTAADVLSLVGQEIVIELREMTATNWVPEHDGFYKLKSGYGFSFSSGQVVGGDNPDADVVVLQNVGGDPSNAIIEAQGDGGIIFQRFDDKVDFYNTPEAPAKDYQRRSQINLQQSGLYFVRTRDGKHYAKFRLLVSLVHPPQGIPYLDLESARLLWAYQTDGTRNLEITPSKNFPFPVEKFGLNRESFPH